MGIFIKNAHGFLYRALFVSACIKKSATDLGKASFFPFICLERDPATPFAERKQIIRTAPAVHHEDSGLPLQRRECPHRHSLFCRELCTWGRCPAIYRPQIHAGCC
mgnify:CR=1 FL=1